MKYNIVAFLFLPFSVLLAQEATSGIDLQATVTGGATYSHPLADDAQDGSPLAVGFRAMLYPTLKMGEHWSVSGAVQVSSTPYLQNGLSAQGYGLQASVLQANIGFSKVWNNASVLIRAGQLSSAFGSFVLRYDDAVNPLLGVPPGYGYYYAPATTAGLAGAQVDVTLGKWDGRVQLVNSSPANPRSIFDKDQYPNWAGGAGYTIRQGFRIGASSYRGPYLDRSYAFFFPGESRPRDLPATAIGTDVAWLHGHWNIYGELQRFKMTYHVIPTFLQSAGYAEVRRVLAPRWYVAARAGYYHTSANSGNESYEAAVGFRPNSHQIIKAGYTIERESDAGDFYRTFGVQLITVVHPFSKALN